jgi:alkylation response protein AidB-like acyl-CoA dehydrogenase
MNFEFSEEQIMLKDQVRKALDDMCQSNVVRGVLEGSGTHDAHLWGALAKLGLQGTAIDEAYGGAGAGYLELCMVAEELGRSLAPVPFSSSIYLAAEAIKLAGNEDQKVKYLSGLASGDRVGTLAAWETSGPLRPGAIKMSLSGSAVSGTKIMVPDGAVADFVVVLVRDGSKSDAASLCLVELDDATTKRESVETIDPSKNFATLTFDDAPARLLGASGEGWPMLNQIFDKAAILFAFEQLGGAQKALDDAVAYAQERYAFGRQIGSFQAIKHMLANMYVDLELARSNCYYGAWALASDASELPLAAATARVSATRAYQHAAKNNIQTHGGMGFTWEFDCHLYYRRSNILALVLGGPTVWKDKLVDQLENSNAA